MADTENKSAQPAPDKGAAEEMKKEGAKKSAHGAELPPLDFTTFILSLSTSVAMNLGLVENPVTKQKELEPAVAKQTIDLIELIKEKTKGNLTGEEEKLLNDVLHELRVIYCKVVV